MASYDYLCETHGETELTHSMFDETPKNCPVCLEVGDERPMKRLISYATPGKVELTGQDMKAKIKADAQQLKRDAASNPNILANLVGDGKFEQKTRQYDKVKQILRRKD